MCFKQKECWSAQQAINAPQWCNAAELLELWVCQLHPSQVQLSWSFPRNVSGSRWSCGCAALVAVDDAYNWVIRVFMLFDLLSFCLCACLSRGATWRWCGCGWTKHATRTRTSRRRPIDLAKRKRTEDNDSCSAPKATDTCNNRERRGRRRLRRKQQKAAGRLMPCLL